MASKLSAATVIEGNISDEGLAAMSDCEDLTTQLAKELISGLKENVEDLAASFKKMAILGNRDTKSKQELVQIPVEAVTAKTPQLDVVINQTVLQPNIPYIKTNGRTYDTGQLSLFDLVA